jgi:hypothetical protein
VSASHSKRAVQDLLATNYQNVRASLQSRKGGVDLAVRLSQRDIRTSWERQATADGKKDGHWEEVSPPTRDLLRVRVRGLLRMERERVAVGGERGRGNVGVVRAW